METKNLEQIVIELQAKVNELQDKLNSIDEQVDENTTDINNITYSLERKGIYTY